MLKKLIKYEWKNVSKIGSILLLATFVVTVVGCILLQMPWMKELYAGGDGLSEVQSVGLTFMLFISFMLYIFMLVGITYGIIIYMGVNFYRTMYTDQGYLAHTLPVTPNQLLISKTLVSGIWYIFVEIGVILSVFALIFSFAAGMMAPEGYSFAEAVASVMEELGVIFDSEFAGFLVHYIVLMVLMVLIAPFYAMITLFGGITIGQLSKKYKALMGILAYFGLGFIMMIIQMVVQMVFTIKMTVDTIQDPMAISEMSMLGIYDSTLIIQIVMGIIIYFVSHHILTKKLNLD